MKQLISRSRICGTCQEIMARIVRATSTTRALCGIKLYEKRWNLSVLDPRRSVQ